MRITIAILLLSSTALAQHASHADYRKAKEKFADAEKAFHQAMTLLQQEYVDPVGVDELYRGAVAGMVAGCGDRKWDTLITPSDYEMMHTELGGQLVGIGVELDDTVKGVLTVIGPFPGSPAEKAGLKAGDRILKVDDKVVKDDQTMLAMSGIRGKAGTPVVLSILRDGEVLSKRIVRATVNIPSVSWLMLPEAAVVWIHSFNERTPEQLRAALKSVAAKKPHGLIFDLRHNMGGLFEKMVDCAGLVMPKGATVAMETVRGGGEQAIRTGIDPILGGVPISVLVDGETASGAELFAGALRDALGAHVVGAKTAGKWNVQKIAELGNGYAIKYTIGLFKTPKGLSLDGKGLEPDVPVDADEHTVMRCQRITDPSARLSTDAQLRAAVALLR
jgi:carboxyl-terminal processing protease